MEFMGFLKKSMLEGPILQHPIFHIRGGDESPILFIISFGFNYELKEGDHTVHYFKELSGGMFFPLFSTVYPVIPCGRQSPVVGGLPLDWGPG